MKNILKRLLLCAFVAIIIFSFASCSFNDFLNSLITPRPSNSTRSPTKSSVASSSKPNNPNIGSTTGSSYASTDDPDDNNGLFTEEEKQIACEVLNTLTEKAYSTIELTITTSVGGNELSSKYVLSADKVEYTIEKLVGFTVEDGVIIAPENHKTTVTGFAEVKGDKIVSIDGNLEIPEYQVLVGGFNFVPSNLNDYRNNGEGETFSVQDASQFMGNNIDASDMTVSVCYDNIALVSLTVAYTTGTADITFNYTFGTLAQ